MSPPFSLTIQTLASGSSGNMAVIRSPRTTLVLDVGLPSRRATGRALDEAGVGADAIAAVLISHSHSDHLHKAALAWFTGSGVPILAGPETAREAVRLCLGNGHVPPPGHLVAVHAGTTYLVEDIEVTPFAVPHDVPTYGFTFVMRGGSGLRKVTVATDLGCTPDSLLPHFMDADAILIEANYDDDLLRRSHRRPFDKARIQSDLGHLSNADAGRFLRKVVDASHRLPSCILLAHLSHDHNDPDLAVQGVRFAMGHASSRISRIEAAPRRGLGPLIRT